MEVIICCLWCFWWLYSVAAVLWLLWLQTWVVNCGSFSIVCVCVCVCVVGAAGICFPVIWIFQFQCIGQLWREHIPLILFLTIFSPFCTKRLTDWLTDLMTDWLNDWLTQPNLTQHNPSQPNLSNFMEQSSSWKANSLVKELL